MIISKISTICTKVGKPGPSFIFGENINGSRKVAHK